jgi:hypothetical protein
MNIPAEIAPFHNENKTLRRVPLILIGQCKANPQIKERITKKLQYPKNESSLIWAQSLSPSQTATIV